jgi:hypothetical protein
MRKLSLRKAVVKQHETSTRCLWDLLSRDSLQVDLFLVLRIVTLIVRKCTQRCPYVLYLDVRFPLLQSHKAPGTYIPCVRTILTRAAIC